MLSYHASRTEQQIFDEKLLKLCSNGELEHLERFILGAPSQQLCAKMDMATALKLASRYGHLSVVEYLLTNPAILKFHEPDVNVQDSVALHEACFWGHMEVVRYLLTSPALIDSQQGIADIHALQEEALSMACANGHLEIVKYLLTSSEITTVAHIHKASDKLPHANVHAQHDRALYKALETQQVKIIEYLVLEYQIEETSDIAKMSKEFPALTSLFQKRILYDHLQALPVNARGKHHKL